jgi:hypothetical protein
MPENRFPVAFDVLVVTDTRSVLRDHRRERRLPDIERVAAEVVAILAQSDRKGT